MWSRNEVFGMLVMLLVHHRASGQQDYGFCRNPHSQEGRCVHIRACEPLLNLLRTYGNAVGDFLRQSVCVYENGDPIVCCPDVPNKGELNDNINNNNNDNNNNNNNNDNNNNNNVPNNNRNNNPFLPAQPDPNSYGPLLSPVCGYTNASYTRVVNGVPAELGFWPWAALLGYRSQKNPRKPRYLCGGALISSRHVLTAGHCVYGRNDLYMVRLGELDIDNDNDGATPIDLPIERKTIHPQYNPTTYTNDIAVLRLAQPIQQFTHLLKPICLPVTRDIQQMDLNDFFPYIVGWGALNFNGPSASVLQQLQVPVVKEGQCRAAYRGKGATIDNRVLCAGYAEGGKDACQGDSGGPLMIPIEKTWYSIGVVSYGFKCAVPGFPGVYTKTQVFLDFILSALN